MVSYHPDFHRKNVGELGKEVTHILIKKRYDPFAKFLSNVMEKGMWSRIKETAGDVEPAKLLKLFRAYRTGELKKHTVTVKVYHSGERELREETLTMEDYLRRLGNSVRLPQRTRAEKLGEIIQNLHALAEAIEREECKEGCNITVSPYPEFFYDEKKDRYYYLPSTALFAFEGIGISPEYIFRAHPRTVFGFFKTEPENVQKILQFYKDKLGISMDYILGAGPDRALRFLQIDPQIILKRLETYEREFGLSRDYIFRLSPNAVLRLLSLRVETVRQRLEKLAKQLGVTIEDLPKIYTPATLLRYITHKKKY